MTSTFESARFVTLSVASPILSIAEADRLLASLDQLAQSDLPERDFWEQFLAVLSGMSSGAGVAILYPVGHEWAPVAKSGEVPAEQLRTLGERVASNEKQTEFEGNAPEGRWVAARIRSPKTNLGRGILWIGYRPSDSESLVASGRLLLQPFCEILRVHQSASDAKFGNAWLVTMNDAIRNFARTNTLHEARQVLVDQLVLAVGGLRASLVSRDADNPFQLQTSSGAFSIDRMSPTVQRLEKLVELASQQETVFSWSKPPDASSNDNEASSSDASRDEFGVFSNGLAFAWDRIERAPQPTWLILEWRDSASMSRAASILSLWCETIFPIWQQTERWTRVPNPIQQRLVQPPRRSTPTIRRQLWKWLGLAWVAVAVAGLCWPIPMTIESDAVLEPASLRLIHASADGFVETLFVEDGHRVFAQQELARLKSPNLDLQIEEAVGQLRAISEKRNGLKVALNQLSPSAADATANQTRLSTELLMLDSNEAHAREMLEFYQAERSRLVLRAPIEGVVVARRLRQELENRPIRRGDPLLQVVDLKGAWQLRIRVADRDTNYVGQFYRDAAASSPISPSTDNRIQFTFDSLPSEQFTATVSRIAQVIENRDGEGRYQEVVADVSQEIASKVHMGAKARVQFACGRQAFAFVWSRPLIEFLQTRLRWFSHRQTLSPATSSTPNPSITP
ncbi:MAG: efflux RND transporter periplasmic adaptor subunit [Pirellula sp.]